MKLLATIAAATLSAAAAHAAITINFSGVALLDSNSSALADGALVQLIASTSDTTFSAPTSASFTSGDDVVISSFAVNSASSGVAGGTVTSLNIPNFTTFTGFDVGDRLLLRWFPLLTLGSSSPGVTTYGEYRTDSTLDGSDIAWFAPADSGGTFTLNVISQPFSGSVPASSLTASLTVIPEPTTFAAFLGLGVLGFAASRRRRA